VVGVVNVTPDSFSDGGRFLDPAAAVAHGLELVAGGADLIDVGGESTRPGAHRIDIRTEIGRVVPVIAALSAQGIACSVDTMRAPVAAAALAAGARIVNDVSGGLADPDLLRVVAEAGCPVFLMHWRGHSDRMDELAVYRDVVADVRAELWARVDAAVAAGIAESALVLDPGIGFAKTAEHNWQLLRHIDSLVDLGFPVLVGASRKRFLGSLLADAGTPRPPDGREAATAAVTALMAAAGAWGVRVHGVADSADAVRVVAAMAAVPAVPAPGTAARPADSASGPSRVEVDD
jgi:dihydropteroate synthase